MKKLMMTTLMAILAITLSLPAAFAVEPPRANDKEPGKEMGFGFGKVAVFDSIKKENDWISTMKVTFFPEPTTTDVIAVSGLTEYKSFKAGEKPVNLDPATIKKGDIVFIQPLMGPPPAEDKEGKTFARMVVTTDLKGQIFATRGREMLGTVNKIDDKTVNILPYGPHPKDKTPEAQTFNLYSNVLVFKADDDFENVTRMKVSDIKANSKVSVSVMPYKKEKTDEKTAPEMFVVMVRLLDNFPEMPKRVLMAKFDSVENGQLKVNPIAIGGGKDDGRPGDKPGNNRPGENILPQDDKKPPVDPGKDRTPKTASISFDSKTNFVLYNETEVKPIKTEDIRNGDKLMMTVQTREINGEWVEYAITVRVMSDFPDQKNQKELKLFATYESSDQYSMTVTIYKADQKATFGLDPECMIIKQPTEEGKRPTVITKADLKAGDKLMIAGIMTRANNPGNNPNPKPNDDKTPPENQPKIGGIIMMVTVVNEFPKPVAAGKIVSIAKDKLVIEPLKMPRKDDDNKEPENIEFVINSDTKLLSMTRKGKTEAKLEEFKADDFVMVQFYEKDNIKTAATITKTEKPNLPNPPPAEGGDQGQPGSQPAQP